MKRYLALLLLAGASTLDQANPNTADAQVANPSITGLGGITNADSGISNGLVNCPLGTNYNGTRAVNDQPGMYPWTITGQNFGNQPGTVTLAGRTVPIIRWTNTSITIDPSGAQINPNASWNWGAMCTTLAIRRSDGRTASVAINISNAISSRLEGQCTQYVAWYRRSMGLQPSPFAYGGYTAFAVTYRPQRGDQLQWQVGQGKHAGIIDYVGAPVTINGRTNYPIRVAQRNAACTNQITTFDTSFAIQGGMIVALPKFSTNSGGALSYYR